MGETPAALAQWTAVDAYFAQSQIAPDEALDAALRDSDAAGLPPHSVAPNQGKLLHLLARMHGARRILEIGTLGAYSTIWLARALPAGGTLTTLEVSDQCAAVATRNIARAGLAHCVEIIVGLADETLARLAAEGRAPYDLVFIDADKPNNTAYLRWAMRLARKGSVIVADNVVRHGAVTDAHSTDASVRGVREFTEALAADRRLSATTVQTVGSKGWDGFTIALVLEM